MKFSKVELPYHFENSKKQGLSNDLLILNNKYFVKRSKFITEAFLNKKNQLNVIRLIKNKPFTLTILEAQITNNQLWILMPYYQNIFTLSNHKIKQNTLQELAKLIKELHTIKTNDTIMTWKPLEKLNLYCNLINAEENVKKQTNEIKKELETWLNNYQPEKIVLSHNDLIADNFVNYQNKWYLIDWDFATLNDQLFDIASFTSETLKKPSDIKNWYQLFNLSENQITTVKQWIKYQNLIWYHWALYLYQKTNIKTYQEIAREKIKMLLS